MFYGAVVWDPWFIVAQNCFPSMLILSNTGSFYGDSCWDSGISDESRVFLWLFLCCSFYSYWLGCHCFINIRFARRSCLYGLFDWEGKEVLRFLSHPLHHPPLDVHHLRRVAILDYMVGGEWNWSCSDGIVRWIFVHQAWAARNTCPISFKRLIEQRN